MNPPHAHVERELSDRNAHAPGALVTEAENALAIGHDDRLNVVDTVVAKHLLHAIPVGIGNEESAGPCVDLTEALTGEPHRRGVDDRHHLREVVDDQSVEEDFVVVLDLPQEDVLGLVARERHECLVLTVHLILQGLDMRWQQAVETEFVALRFGEGGALVAERLVDQFATAQLTHFVLHGDSVLEGKRVQAKRTPML
jgi:hypothetical protein